ncbi:hypothetical protein NM688_g7396 [Phlebia brevispora]|uniref:Uncharacterized protein n=1 Tax=Phlebia brevispora TaxID=194682 RepID=A0ACC1S5J2_9APHY|nr:hypothetical protein NM688_g7396 [Phlebia brevispora]
MFPEQRERSVTPFESPYICLDGMTTSANVNYKLPRMPHYVWTEEENIMILRPFPWHDKLRDAPGPRETRYFYKGHDVTEFFEGEKTLQRELVWDSILQLWRFPDYIEKYPGSITYNTFATFNVEPIERPAERLLCQFFGQDSPFQLIPEEDSAGLTSIEVDDVEMEYLASGSEPPLAPVTPPRRTAPLPSMDEDENEGRSVATPRCSPSKSRRSVRFAPSTFNKRGALDYPLSASEKEAVRSAIPGPQDMDDALPELPHIQLPTTPRRKKGRLSLDSALDGNAWTAIENDIDNDIPIALRRSPRKPRASADLTMSISSPAKRARQRSFSISHVSPESPQLQTPTTPKRRKNPFNLETNLNGNAWAITIDDPDSMPIAWRRPPRSPSKPASSSSVTRLVTSPAQKPPSSRAKPNSRRCPATARNFASVYHFTFITAHALPSYNKLSQEAMGAQSTANVFEKLQAEFSPPLDTSLIAAMVADYLADGSEPSEEELNSLRQALTELAAQAEKDENSFASQLSRDLQITPSDVTTSMDAHDVFSSNDQNSPYTATTSRGSTFSDGSVQPFSSPLGFLQTAFPHLPTARLKSALGSSEDAEDVDMEEVVERILATEFVKELEERGLSDEELPPSEPWHTVKKPKKKGKKKRGNTITLVDIRQQQHAPPAPSTPSMSRGAPLDPWTQVTSLASRLSDLLPSQAPSYFQSLFHSPKYLSPSDALRDGLASMKKEPSSADPVDASSEEIQLALNIFNIMR